jgi:uncharacterized phage protein (TIGR02218 family)
MSYDSIEQSSFDGNPVELYKFSKSTSLYHQTSSNEEVTYAGGVYTPNPIERDDVALTGEINKSPMTIMLDRDNEVAQLFKVGFPSTIVSISLFRQHLSDANTILFWRGRVSSCAFIENTAKLTCESIFTSIKRTGLYRNYQRSCPHMLYDNLCKIAKSGVNGTVQGVSTTTITSSTFATQANGWWVGGIFESGGEQRYIFSHSGNTIVLNRSIPQLAVGAPMTILAGCDRSKATCISKFNNLNNYGGFPYIPTDNPFGSQGIT